MRLPPDLIETIKVKLTPTNCGGRKEIKSMIAKETIESEQTIDDGTDSPSADSCCSAVRPSLGLLLRKKFAPPEWAVAFEVRDATGARGSRWADAVAVNCYPSRGLAVHGFEFKVSRGDWLRELRSPDKSVAVQRYCDFWWLVVDEAKIVANGELPDQWGLLVGDGKSLKQIKQGPKLESQPMDRLFAASLLRAMLTGMIHEKQIEGRVAEEFQRGKESGERSSSWELKRVTGDLKKTNERVEKFESLSGVSIDDWDLDNIAQTVKWIKEGGLAASRDEVSRAADRCRKLASQADAMLAEWPQ